MLHINDGTAMGPKELKIHPGEDEANFYARILGITPEMCAAISDKGVVLIKGVLPTPTPKPRKPKKSKVEIIADPNNPNWEGTYAELCERYAMNYFTVKARLYRGLSLKDALEKPIHKKEK